MKTRACTKTACIAARGGEDPLYMAYHDTEWGVPDYDDRAVQKLILDGFQAGLYVDHHPAQA